MKPAILSAALVTATLFAVAASRAADPVPVGDAATLDAAVTYLLFYPSLW